MHLCDRCGSWGGPLVAAVYLPVINGTQPLPPLAAEDAWMDVLQAQWEAGGSGGDSRHGQHKGGRRGCCIHSGGPGSRRCTAYRSPGLCKQHLTGAFLGLKWCFEPMA